MLRIILKYMDFDQCTGSVDSTVRTVDVDLPEVEQLMRGKDNGRYIAEMYQLVGIEVLPQSSLTGQGDGL